jgi:SAM-dependent methyltransferase
MTAKSQSSLAPTLLRNQQYSGTVATVLYNWPIFIGILLFSLSAVVVTPVLAAPWHWVVLGAGLLGLIVMANILIGAFIAYDWGQSREYERLAELGNIPEANVVIDVTAGKLRGSRGLLPLLKGGHYFVVDIFDPAKMADQALRRARRMEPPLEADRRIYKRRATPDTLPIPHRWADVVYCSFSLHELNEAADRDAIFKEFHRILKPDGKLVMAEHGRDWLNFLAFGPAMLSFFSPATWRDHLDRAEFEVKHYERWRGLVHLWVAQKESRRR